VQLPAPSRRRFQASVRTGGSSAPTRPNSPHVPDDLPLPPAVLAIFAGLTFLLVVVVVLYNRLVAARQRVRESWSSVDVELQRRHDLVPNLVATVKGALTHERELLEEVTRLRGEAEARRPGPASNEQVATERRLESALHRLVVRIEAYPELRTQPNVANLMGELAHTEDRVSSALRYYNGNVRELNTKVETFPTLLVAGAFSFTRAEYFQLESEAARAAPRVDLSSARANASANDSASNRRDPDDGDVTR